MGIGLIPQHYAASVGAHRRDDVQSAVVVPVYGELFSTATHHGRVAWCQPSDDLVRVAVRAAAGTSRDECAVDIAKRTPRIENTAILLGCLALCDEVSHDGSSDPGGRESPASEAGGDVESIVAKRPDEWYAIGRGVILRRPTVFGLADVEVFPCPTLKVVIGFCPGVGVFYVGATSNLQ